MGRCQEVRFLVKFSVFVKINIFTWMWLYIYISYLDEVSERSGSPFIDVEKVSSDDEDQLELTKRRLMACKNLKHLSRVMRKPTFWFPTWSDTNQAMQSQNMARGLKFCI